MQYNSINISRQLKDLLLLSNCIRSLRIPAASVFVKRLMKTPPQVAFGEGSTHEQAQVSIFLKLGASAIQHAIG